MKYFFLLLLFSFLCLGDLSAQVGINNPSPSQALDVGGKIKVGDDEIAPVAGTIRYNRVSKTFEGYDGTEWSVFNPDPDDDGGGSNTPLAGDQVRAQFKIGNFPASGRITSMTWWYGTSGVNYFDNVPAGRSIRVTSIIVGPANQVSGYDLRLTSLTSSGFPVPASEIHLYSDQGASPFYMSDPTGQQLIIHSGGSLQIEYESFRGTVKIVGYLE